MALSDADGWLFRQWEIDPDNKVSGPSWRYYDEGTQKILLFYSHMQQAYQDLAKAAPCPVQLLAGCDHFTDALTTPAGTLIIVDDMQATHAGAVSAWFTCKSHHYNTSVIHLVQNVFDKDPEHRTISLNATYIVLFKNPRDKSQVTHLDKQV